MKNTRVKHLQYSTLCRYFLKSCLVTVVDISVVFLLYRFLHVNLVIANSVGVLCGFLLDYIITARFVFQNAEGAKGFLVFFGTFLLGLLLADWLIYIGSTYIFVAMGEKMNFFCSKGSSIVGPFLILYGIRKGIYSRMERREKRHVISSI